MPDHFFAGSQLFEEIAQNFHSHSTETIWWSETSHRLQESEHELAENLQSGQLDLGELGRLRFPFHEMGAINSTHLFGLHELILFSFYWKNRNRYKLVADLGANIGLHSLVLELMGFSTKAYEPDPDHYAVMKSNLKANGVYQNQTINKAVATSSAEVEFIRVLGNTTGSHIAGAKQNPYGAMETIRVEAENIREALVDVELVKMDVEGLEAELVDTLALQDFLQADFLAEVGSETNADRISKRIQELPGIRIFSQKKNWAEVNSLSDMPHSHREGSIFISSKSSMPWHAQTG